MSSQLFISAPYTQWPVIGTLLTSYNSPKKTCVPLSWKIPSFWTPQLHNRNVGRKWPEGAWAGPSPDQDFLVWLLHLTFTRRLHAEVASLRHVNNGLSSTVLSNPASSTMSLLSSRFIIIVLLRCKQSRGEMYKEDNYHFSSVCTLLFG